MPAKITLNGQPRLTPFPGSREIYPREIVKANNDRSKREYHYRKHYGLSIAEVEAIRERQSGLCAICRIRPAKDVDHDHRTKRPRGLLCHGCNLGLGYLHDSPERLVAALEYLNAFT